MKGVWHHGMCVSSDVCGMCVRVFMWCVSECVCMYGCVCMSRVWA